MKREQLRFKCPLPVKDIQSKRVHVSFTLDHGTSVATGIGEMMITSNSSGLSLAWLQFQDSVNQAWVRLYMNEERIRLLKKVDKPQCDFLIEQVLDSGPELED
ncbi:MAG: hypothetical protein A2283_11180 [Lentisphaerae bacterium RIFOXYA12_FULL_48_11]|nr:MAG: hypothetical protein A2283_11180 [Lentisphaerae bacterium RIFOXYA12_FULL_48_11]